MKWFRFFTLVPSGKFFSFFTLFLIVGFAVYLGKQPLSWKKFVVLITTERQRDAYHNLRSALSQNYPYFRIIYMDRNEGEKGKDSLQKAVRDDPKSDRVTYVSRPHTSGHLENIFHAVHNVIHNDEIVVVLHDEDSFAHRNVLQNLNRYYNKGTNPIWVTFCQDQGPGKSRVHDNKMIPKFIVQGHAFRYFRYLPFHVRSFPAWLFKKISLEDLSDEGKFYENEGDLPFLVPLLEMAGDRFVFIKEPLFICTHTKMRHNIDGKFLARPEYPKLHISGR